LVGEKPYTVTKDNLLYKCGWSPLEGTQFPYQINSTFVSGHLAYHLGAFNESQKGSRLQFSRE
jgi:dihydroorotase